MQCKQGHRHTRHSDALLEDGKTASIHLVSKLSSVKAQSIKPASIGIGWIHDDSLHLVSVTELQTEIDGANMLHQPLLSGLVQLLRQGIRVTLLVELSHELPINLEKLFMGVFVLLGTRAIHLVHAFLFMVEMLLHIVAQKLQGVGKGVLGMTFPDTHFETVDHLEQFLVLPVNGLKSGRVLFIPL